jgi:hypothetical protein
MKKLIILLMLNFLLNDVQAQTFDELFKQKEAQKKYLLQQIGLLKIYLNAVKKGYSIAKKGLTTIGDIKDGDFYNHSDYFNSLKNVNPKIADHEKIEQIISMQSEILNTFKYFYSQVEKYGAFNQDEIDYVYRVYERLLDECNYSRNELILITTSGKLEMKDNERLERIDVLYWDMQDKFTFSQNFGNETLTLATHRIQEKNNIQTSHILNVIKNDYP